MSRTSLLANFDNQVTKTRIEQFQSLHGNMSVATDSKCRFAMVYAVMTQYFEYLLSKQELTTEDRSIALQRACVEFITSYPRYMSSEQWEQLQFRIKEDHAPGISSVSAKIKTAFLYQFPSSLKSDPALESLYSELEEITEDVGSDSEETEISHEALTYIDGYYDHVVTRMKNHVKDLWFQTL